VNKESEVVLGMLVSMYGEVKAANALLLATMVAQAGAEGADEVGLKRLEKSMTELYKVTREQAELEARIMLAKPPF